jgi:hypothetical protein
MLLEQLQQPLVFAMQQNVVVYEAEDGLESELGYDTVLDQEQLTVLDRAKQGAVQVVKWSTAVGCLAVQQLRTMSKALAQAARRAWRTSRKPSNAAPKAANEATASTSRGNSSSIGDLSTANSHSATVSGKSSTVTAAAAAPAAAVAPPAGAEPSTGGSKVG